MVEVLDHGPDALPFPDVPTSLPELFTATHRLLQAQTKCISTRLSSLRSSLRALQELCTDLPTPSVLSALPDPPLRNKPSPSLSPPTPNYSHPPPNPLLSLVLRDQFSKHQFGSTATFKIHQLRALRAYDWLHSIYSPLQSPGPMP
ncbi:hypothetical protein D9756_004443 [Leucocoprinus leucothites]|uniref:Uncharacterized protein n=1 Tax=Leucocoprinus leucothites TaxID=201217 RepID=A0A8H5LKY2_9AGAR|nr:hypothetical protein D9756_004443 [Leucoagaricus leucothites]